MQDSAATSFQIPMTSGGSATTTPTHHKSKKNIPRHKRRCKSVGANARNYSFVFPKHQQYAEFEMTMPCCSSETEMNTMAGSAVAFSKNLINRISTRFRQKKPLQLQLKPIQIAPERVSYFFVFILLKIFCFKTQQKKLFFARKVST
jgi:hypothetical protein